MIYIFIALIIVIKQKSRKNQENSNKITFLDFFIIFRICTYDRQDIVLYTRYRNRAYEVYHKHEHEYSLSDLLKNSKY